MCRACSKLSEKIQSSESLTQIERLKNAKRMKIYRKNLKEKLKNDDSLSKKLKADHRNRMETYRKKIKQQNQQEQRIISLDGAYKCKNTLYKALKKVELALPKDINKKKEILRMHSGRSHRTKTKNSKSKICQQMWQHSLKLEQSFTSYSCFCFIQAVLFQNWFKREIKLIVGCLE